MPKLPIGKKVRAYRKSFGLSQSALALQIGLKGNQGGTQISRYEHGVKEPRIDTLMRIAAVFGVTVDSLLRATK